MEDKKLVLELTLAEFLLIKSKPILEVEILSYIEEYRPYIEFTCKKAYFLRQQWEDMEQFVITELIKGYCNKWKYDDFEWVTRSIIRRKAMDFVNNYCMRNKDLVFENQYVNNEGYAGDKDGENLVGGHFVKRSVSNFKLKEKNDRIVAFIKDIQHKINNKPYSQYFSDFSREYMETVLFLYELGYDCDKQDILECMGYETSETTKFNAKLSAFRTKLTEYFSLEMDLF